MSHTLQKRRIVRGIIAGALALAAVAGVSQNAWADTVQGDGLTVTGNGISNVVTNNSNSWTIKAGAGDITVSGTSTANTTFKPEAGYAGTITFNGVRTGNSNTITFAKNDDSWPTSGLNIAFSGTNTITTPAASGLLGASASAPTVPVTITTNANSTTTIQGENDATTSTILTNGANLTFAGPGDLTVLGGANTQSQEAAVVAIGADGGAPAASGKEAVGVITFASGSNVTAKGGEATSSVGSEAVWATGGLVVEKGATLTATASAGAQAGANGAIGINLVAKTGSTNYGGNNGGKVAASTIAGTVKTTGGASLATNTLGQSGLSISQNDTLTVASTGSLTATGGAATGTSNTDASGGDGLTVSGALTVEQSGQVSATGGAATTGSSVQTNGGRGLNVADSAKTLSVQGTLTAEGGNGAMQGSGGAGISVGTTVDTVSIGGTVNATGGGVIKSTSGSEGTAGPGISMASPVTFDGDITATGGPASSTATNQVYGASGINNVNTTSGSAMTIKSGTVTATGSQGAQGKQQAMTGCGINTQGPIYVNDGTLTATSGSYFAGATSADSNGSIPAGIALVDTSLVVRGGTVNAQGANSPLATGGGPVGGVGINAATVSSINSGATPSITLTGGSLNIEGGSGGAPVAGLWVTSGSAIGQLDTAGGKLNLEMENYEGTAGEGPTLSVLAGVNPSLTGKYGGGPYKNRAIAAQNSSSITLTLVDGIINKQANCVFYPWLCLTGAEETPNTVQGLAGMSTPVSSMNIIQGSNATTPAQHSVLIEPAPLTALGLEVDGDFATAGSTLTPTIQNGTFTTPEGESETYEFANSSLVAVGAVQPGENYTVSAKGNEATINTDAKGNEVTLTAATPSSIQELYENLTEATENIPMTYPITLNANGGSFPLYSGEQSQRPTDYNSYTLWTQPGTGMLLNVADSNYVNDQIGLNGSSANKLGTYPGQNATASGVTANLTAVLGALPEATTTNQETPYFQDWFTEAEGGEKAAQPFDTTQTIYAQFGAEPPAQEPGKVTIYRLYNPYSHEHLFTQDVSERDGLMDAGWQGEGVAWIAPEASDTPVYRLYNRYNQDHYYCTSSEEANYLESLGWTYDFERGAAFYGAPQTEVAIYQLFNPYEQTNTHLWTGNFTEYTDSQALGWKGEGTVWYALSLS